MEYKNNSHSSRQQLEMAVSDKFNSCTERTNQAVIIIGR